MTNSILTPEAGETRSTQSKQSLKEMYDRDGFVVVPNIIPSERLAEVRLMIDKVMDGSVRPNKVSKADFKINYEPSMKDDPNVPRAQKIRVIFDLCHSHDFFWDLATSPEILDAVESLIGPNIKLYTDQMFAKPAHHGSEVPYHQDSAYWPNAEPRLISCWLAVDDVTVQNGCVRYIPGSHKKEIPHFNDKTRKTNPIGIREEDVDSHREVPVEIKAGSAIFHHSLTVHRSFPNESDHSRRGLVMIYMPADIQFYSEWKSEYGFPVVRSSC
jgi:phytanoyl-CoA hydroxylase